MNFDVPLIDKEQRYFPSNNGMRQGRFSQFDTGQSPQSRTPLHVLIVSFGNSISQVQAARSYNILLSFLERAFGSMKKHVQ